MEVPFPCRSLWLEKPNLVAAMMVRCAGDDGLAERALPIHQVNLVSCLQAKYANGVMTFILGQFAAQLWVIEKSLLFHT